MFKSKIKLDQFLVNFLDSISHFQHKNIGIKMFIKFISE